MRLRGVYVTDPQIRKFTDNKTGEVQRNMQATIVDEDTNAVYEIVVYESDRQTLPTADEIKTMRFQRVELNVKPGLRVDKQTNENTLRLSVLPGQELVGQSLVGAFGPSNTMQNITRKETTEEKKEAALSVR